MNGKVIQRYVYEKWLECQYFLLKITSPYGNSDMITHYVNLNNVISPEVGNCFIALTRKLQLLPQINCDEWFFILKE